MLRWQLEVTYHEVRAPLDPWASRRERQWAERAIRRTTPALLGLFSVVTLLAHEHFSSTPPTGALHQAAGYAKSLPTFLDALALVRRRLWTQMKYPTSPCCQDLVKVSRAFRDHLTDLLCYAA